MADFRMSDLITAQMMRESSNNPMAVSPSGASGLMQIMPKDAHDLYGSSAPSVFDEARARGFDTGSESVGDAARLLRDPEISMALGDPYLRDLLRRHNGNIDYALTAYNAGPGAMSRMINSGGGIQDMPNPEQREYAQKIRKLYLDKVGQEMPTTMDTMQLTRPKARPMGLLEMTNG